MVNDITKQHDAADWVNFPDTREFSCNIFTGKESKNLVGLHKYFPGTAIISNDP